MISIRFYFVAFILIGKAIGTSFDENYAVVWGFDHVRSLFNGYEIELSMDPSSGAGFNSKLSYGTGSFQMKIKVPNRDSAGVVTAFYLTSIGNNRDELDFEFLGNTEGNPYTLQTNVFVNGEGNREQRFLLWFDPTTDYHTYEIFYNHHQIVFYVDGIPIRVFKNNYKLGVGYPTHPMQVEGSLWNGESWATGGGKIKIDWNYAPFKAYFQEFDINGCNYIDNTNINTCYSSKYWWNQKKYHRLDAKQQEAYENVRKKYMNYDYCSDTSRYSVPAKECYENTNNN